MGGSERPGGGGCSDRLDAVGSVVEVGGQRRVEHEVWDRLGLGRVEGRGLVEEEVSLGWPTGGRDRGRSVGQFEMFEDGEDDGWVSEEGEHVHLATTGGTQQRQHLVDPSEQSGPTDTSGVAGASGIGIGAGLRP